MKKLLLASLVGSMVAASSLVAGDWYVGGDVGRAQIKADVKAVNLSTGASASASSSDTKSGFGAKVGYSLDGANNVEVEYINQATNYNTTRLDYVYKYNAGTIKPFIGAGVGVATYKEDLSALGTSSFNKTATAWNLKGGLSYDISKNHEIELGYDYISVGSMSQNFVVSGQTINIKVDNAKTGRFYLGYNYHF
jgi:opacity protein-like surface antigen